MAVGLALLVAIPIGTLPAVADETRPNTTARSTATSATLTTPKAVDAVTPQVVPPATGDNAVITVKVGGARLTQTTVGGLAGVHASASTTARRGPTVPAVGLPHEHLHLRRRLATAASPFPTPRSAARTGTGGSGWCAPESPDGFFRARRPGHGAGRRPVRRRRTYQFRTGAQLRDGNVYSSGRQLHARHRRHGVPTASGGIWQNQREQPGAPAQVRAGRRAGPRRVRLGGSGSLPDLKAAANTFVNALVGTPSSAGARSPSPPTRPLPAPTTQNRPLTPVSTQAGADAVNGWINGDLGRRHHELGPRTLPGGLRARPQFDVAVVITDGNPTVYGNPRGPATTPASARSRTASSPPTRSRPRARGWSRSASVPGISAGAREPAGDLRAQLPTATTTRPRTTRRPERSLRGPRARAAAPGSVTVIKQVVPSTTARGVHHRGDPGRRLWTFNARIGVHGRHGRRPPS